MAKLKTHVKQLKSINCSKIHLWAFSKMFWHDNGGNLEAHVLFLFIHIEVSIPNELESQIIHGPPFQNAIKQQKFKNVSKVIL